MLPRCDTGSSGRSADLARSSANGMFFSNSAWIGLVVLEDEAARRERVGAVDRAADAAAGAAVELDGVGQGAVVVVRRRRGVAVGGVELGRDVGVEARDRRVVVVAGQRLHQRRRRWLGVSTCQPSG